MDYTLQTDPETGKQAPVGTPDSVHVLTQLPGKARGVYHVSGAIRFGPAVQVHLYGSDGTLKYLVEPDDQLLVERLRRRVRRRRARTRESS